MTTDRDYADKAWLNEPVPFVVRVMDALRILALLASLVVIGLLVVAAKARATSQVTEAEWRVFLPLFVRHRDPINAPRCQRYNAAGERLVYSIAVQPDGGEWRLDCRYDAGARA